MVRYIAEQSSTRQSKAEQSRVEQQDGSILLEERAHPSRRSPLQQWLGGTVWVAWWHGDAEAGPPAGRAGGLVARALQPVEGTTRRCKRRGSPRRRRGLWRCRGCRVAMAAEGTVETRRRRGAPARKMAGGPGAGHRGPGAGGGPPPHGSSAAGRRRGAARRWYIRRATRPRQRPATPDGEASTGDVELGEGQIGSG